MINIYSINIQGLNNLDKKTKILQFVGKFKPDVLAVQETNMDLISPNFFIPNYRVFYNHAIQCFSGTALFVSTNFQILSNDILIAARLQKIKLKCDDSEISIYNLHMSHKDVEALSLVGVLHREFSNSTSDHDVLCGDFNYVDNLQLDRVRSTSDRPHLRRAMQNFFSNFNLFDSFRVLFPDLVQITHTGVQRHKPQARLDRIYISSSLTISLKSAMILPPIGDHSIVSVSLAIGGSEGRPSLYWKMPKQILSDKFFLLDSKNLLERFITQGGKSLRSYEALKFSIKSLAMTYQTFNNKKYKQEIRELQNLNSQDDSKELFRELLAGVSVGVESLNPDHVARKIAQHADSISIERAQEGKESEERSGFFFDYFSKIMAADNVQTFDLELYLSDLPKIDDSFLDSLNCEFSEAEFEKAIGELHSDTCPGLDGLTSEFYKTFSSQYCQILPWLWGESVKCNLLPVSLRSGVVSLIFKKGSIDDLANWRPITMSNTDFKIFATILKNRFALVLKSLIGDYQTCNVEGRSIYDNLSFLRDHLNTNVNGAILSIDQDNAFPRVNHGYMSACLKAYGFPPRFISWVELMYREISVVVNFGDGLTPKIEFRKGVKQGDPMASALYILTFEPFLRKLHKGMLEIAPGPFPEAPECNLSAYADDTVPLISHPAQLTLVERELAEYGQFSGGKVKISKCSLFPLGNWQNIQIPSPYPIEKSGLKILGIYFGDFGLNWAVLLTKFKSKLEFYRKSNASCVFSRAKILNTFLLPILWYVLKILDPPLEFLKDIESLCINYLWGGTKNWVKKPFVFAPVEVGGAGIRHPKCQSLVFRFRALVKAFSSNSSDYFLSKMKVSCYQIIFENSASSPFYGNLRIASNLTGFSIWGGPENCEAEIALSHSVYFPSNQFQILQSLGPRKVGEVEEFVCEQAQIINNLPAPRHRRFEAELNNFRAQLSQIKSNITDSEGLSFCCVNPLTNEREQYSYTNDYLSGYFSEFPASSFSDHDLVQMRSKKWERLKGTRLNNAELSIIWRLWHNGILNYPMAQSMRLFSDGNCAYCAAKRPEVRHIVFCKASDKLWEKVWKVAEKAGFTITKKERLFGYEKSPLLNTIVFSALLASYNGFLRTVNSGKKDQNLVKLFTQLLYEKVYLEFVTAKSGNLSKFNAFWGSGLFKINEGRIDIRI